MASSYRRVLLKLSGEALQGDQGFGIDAKVLDRVATEIAGLADTGVERALVIGGGNLFRGAQLAAAGLDRVAGDHMGMLATIMNALAMADALRRAGASAVVMSAVPLGGICEAFSRDRAVDYLSEGKVVLFAAGTGNPFFTTDTAASLRAIEIHADLMIKATNVDGVYSADPRVDRQATRYVCLSYDEALDRRLGVMDLSAMVMCRDHQLAMRVLDMNRPGSLREAVTGDPVGTLVTAATDGCDGVS